MYDFDYLLSKVGFMGPYQVMVILMAYYFGIPSGLNGLASVFMSYQPDFRCCFPQLDNSSIYNLTEEQILECTTPYDQDKEKYDGCNRYSYNVTKCVEDNILHEKQNETIPCDAGYCYDRSLFTETVVTEFDLVCDRLVLSAASTSIYMLGVLLGSLIFGNISDRIGRKPTIVITAMGAFVGMLGAGFSHHYWLYSFCRLLISFFGFGATIGTFVFIMEVIGPKWRTLVGVAYQAMFAIGYMILSGVAYQWRDWHDMQFACLVISLPFGLFLFFIPESPRWLFSQEKNKRARKITEKMAKFNNKILKEEDWVEAEAIGNEKLEISKKEQESEVKYSPLDLFGKPGIRIITFKVMFNWMVNSLVYYGVSLNVGSLSGNIFINNVIGGCMELVSYLICILTMEYAGRRLLLALMLLISGISLLVCAIVNEYAGDDEALITLTNTFAFIGKLGISGSYAIIYNFTTELYPTVVRANGIGVGSAAARIGGILAPIVIVSQYYVSWLANSIFGVFAIVAGLLSFTFPETTGIKMLETLDEAERFYAGEIEEDSDVASESSSDLRKEACRVNGGYSKELSTEL